MKTKTFKGWFTAYGPEKRRIPFQTEANSWTAAKAYMLMLGVPAPEGCTLKLSKLYEVKP